MESLLHLCRLQRNGRYIIHVHSMLFRFFKIGRRGLTIYNVKAIWIQKIQHYLHFSTTMHHYSVMYICKKNSDCYRMQENSQYPMGSTGSLNYCCSQHIQSSDINSQPKLSFPDHILFWFTWTNSILFAIFHSLKAVNEFDGQW